ncbi:MAG: alpha/beta hydrolase [Acetatifactor sp.]|nr:alpha/beta hydrolase [Acetatifactor sp.]
MKKRGWAAIMLGAAAAAGIGESVYFYRRTMKRNKAKTERTMKMAGTDWSQYFDFIEERKERLLARPNVEVYVQTNDDLKLHGTYFPQGDEKKVVLCFHGYTSEGMKDYLALSDYYLKKGYGLLLVDERAHGESEGEYIGFGCLDRQDALCWIDWIIERCGEDVEILMHGTSMGGATVLMASGLTLPPQVKGIVSDCGFTSPKEVFTHVMHSMYHLPAFPVIPAADVINKRLAGYGMDECNAAREVRKATVPILMIHGDADTFVPVSMCEEIYENIASPKQKLIVEGAAHAESYYKDTESYEQALDQFIASL